MTLISLTLALLAAPPSCSGHMLPHQRPDAASVRQADSAWDVAYAHGDTTFLRCLLTPDYRGYTLDGVESDRAVEVGRAGRSGSPDKAVPPYPKNATVVVHGTSAWVGGLTTRKRWMDIYHYEDGAWHAFLSIDVKLPPPAP